MLVGGRQDLQLRDRTVLGVLVVRRCIPVTVDEIGFALWCDDPPASFRKVIQGSIMRLRRVLGAEAIHTVDDGYQLAVDAAGVDACAFERSIGAARDQLTAGHAERAAREARGALMRWRGEPLAELDGWVTAEAERVACRLCATAR